MPLHKGFYLIPVLLSGCGFVSGVSSEGSPESEWSPETEAPVLSDEDPALDEDQDPDTVAINVYETYVTEVITVDAAPVLTMVTDAEGCGYWGGHEFLAGYDDDGDGALGDDEVTSSQVVCSGSGYPEVFEGDLIIRNEMEYQAAQDVSVVTGYVSVQPYWGREEFTFGLVEIGDDFRMSVGDDREWVVSLPALTVMGDTFDWPPVNVDGDAPLLSPPLLSPGQ